MGHEQDVRCGQAAARTPVGARRQTRPHPGPLADGLRLVVVGGSPCSPCAAGARQICEMPLQAAFAARRSQKSSKRPLSRQQRRAMMALPPARLKQRTRRQSPSLGRRRSRRFPRLGNGRAGRPEPVADAPSAPSVPTSPCPPFGKAKRAVIRLPTSVHDDLVRRRRRGGDLGSVVPHDVPVLRHVRALLLHLLVGRAVPGCDLGPQVVHVLARGVRSTTWSPRRSG